MHTIKTFEVKAKLTRNGTDVEMKFDESEANELAAESELNIMSTEIVMKSKEVSNFNNLQRQMAKQTLADADQEGIATLRFKKLV